jgi:DNA-binding transcriptional ArsR family regulator
MISNDNPCHEPGPHDGSLEKMEGVFQALGSEIRLRILIFLAQGSRAAGDIAAQFDISKPAVSKHLGVLQQAGLVASRRKGQFVYYGLTGGQVAGVFKQYLQLLNRSLPAPAEAPRRLQPRQDYFREDVPPVVTWLKNPK